MSVGESPPQRPPQVSPDGQWVWDGSEWQPVAGPSSGHKSVFPSWNSITADRSVPVAEALPAVAQAQAPVIDYAAAFPASQQPAAPRWQQPVTGAHRYLYIAAGVVVAVMGLIFLNSLGPVSFLLPGSGTSPKPAAATPAPPTAGTRSDLGRADRFVVGMLNPAMTALSPNPQLLKETCNGLLTISCKNAITVTDKPVKDVIAVIDHQAVPPCIAGAVTKVRTDLTGMDAGMQTMLKGYKDSKGTEVKQGLSRFLAAYKPLSIDVAAVAKAEKGCDTQLVGP
jgi:hypothetical protein